VGLVAVVVVVLAALLLAPEPSREYRLVFQNASQLVKGGVVRIGGNAVGTIKDIDLTDNQLALVTVSVKEEFAPLREGTTATVRAQGQAGIASRYVDISPGSGLGKPLDDNALIAMESTQSTVEIDEIFNMLDEQTREGLQKTIKGFAQWNDGKAKEANATAKQFPRAMRAFSRLAKDINAQNSQLERLLTTSGQALGGVAANHQELTAAVGNARKTVSAIGADTEALTSVLENVPGMLEQGTEALNRFDPALDDLERLAAASDEPSRILAPYLKDELTPVLEAAGPNFRQLRQMLDRDGDANDVLDSLRDLPPLERATRTAFPEGSEALKTSTPMVSFFRPYGPDLIGWFRGFASSAANYDGAGHYFRTLPVFDAFRFVDDAAGGHFVEKPPAERGRAAGLTTGNTKRCPGAAIPAPADGSAPFVDRGPLANADCDPTQRPGGTR
jgi:phospholipid/cholesterol/gamma-HCH transport system substrate-binding protein